MKSKQEKEKNFFGESCLQIRTYSSFFGNRCIAHSLIPQSMEKGEGGRRERGRICLWAFVVGRILIVYYLPRDLAGRKTPNLFLKLKLQHKQVEQTDQKTQQRSEEIDVFELLLHDTHEQFLQAQQIQ